MAQSSIDICNSALQKLGAASIVSFTDNSREARQCNIAYDSNRRSELRKHRWNFAIARVSLSPDASAPAFDYKYQYTLPGDCLRVLLPTDATLDWVVEGRKVLTNYDNPLNLRYITDVTDTTQFDPAFYDMLCIALAIDLCESLTNATGKKQLLQAEYKDAVSSARRNNAFEQLPADPPDDSLWLVRL